MNARICTPAAAFPKSWNAALAEPTPGRQEQEAHEPARLVTDRLAVDAGVSRENLPTILRQREGPATRQARVEPGGEYRDLCQDLAGPAHGAPLSVSTGGQIVERVRMRDEMYWGPVCRQGARSASHRMEGWRLHGTSRSTEPGGRLPSQNSGGRSSRAPSSAQPAERHPRAGGHLRRERRGHSSPGGRSAGLERPQRTSRATPSSISWTVPVPPDHGKVRTDPSTPTTPRHVPSGVRGKRDRAHRPPPGNVSSEDADRIEERLRCWATSSERERKRSDRWDRATRKPFFV